MMILKRTEYFRRSNTGCVPNLMTAPGDGGCFFFEGGGRRCEILWISLDLVIVETKAVRLIN